MDWQTPLALLCVAAGVGWWVWQSWRGGATDTATGCGSTCAGCPQQDATRPSAAEGFVSLDAVLDSTGQAVDRVHPR